jgi:hypothetical protein
MFGRVTARIETLQVAFRLFIVASNEEPAKSLVVYAPPFCDQLISNIIFVDVAYVGDRFATNALRGNNLNIIEPD